MRDKRRNYERCMEYRLCFSSITNIFDNAKFEVMANTFKAREILLKHLLFTTPVI